MVEVEVEVMMIPSLVGTYLPRQQSRACACAFDWVGTYRRAERTDGCPVGMLEGAGTCESSMHNSPPESCSAPSLADVL